MVVKKKKERRLGKHEVKRETWGYLRPRENKRHHFGTKATSFEMEKSLSNTNFRVMCLVPESKNSVPVSEDL